MPTFRYRALTPAGELVSGALSAPSAAEVAHRIAYLGLIPIEAGHRAERGREPRRRRASRSFSRPRAEDVTIFTGDLALLLRTGARINEALELLAADADIGRMRPTISGLDRGRPLRRKFRRGARQAARGIPADLCRAGPGRRGLGHAGPDSRGAERGASASRGAAPPARRRAALSGLSAAGGRRRADLLPDVRAAAVRRRVSRLQRQARPGAGVLPRAVGFPARATRDARGSPALGVILALWLSCGSPRCAGARSGSSRDCR